MLHFKRRKKWSPCRSWNMTLVPNPARYWNACGGNRWYVQHVFDHRNFSGCLIFQLWLLTSRFETWSDHRRSFHCNFSEHINSSVSKTCLLKGIQKSNILRYSYSWMEHRWMLDRSYCEGFPFEIRSIRWLKLFWDSLDSVLINTQILSFLNILLMTNK